MSVAHDAVRAWGQRALKPGTTCLLTNDSVTPMHYRGIVRIIVRRATTFSADIRLALRANDLPIERELEYQLTVLNAVSGVIVDFEPQVLKQEEIDRITSFAQRRVAMSVLAGGEQ